LVGPGFSLKCLSDFSLEIQSNAAAMHACAFIIGGILQKNNKLLLQ